MSKHGDGGPACFYDDKYWHRLYAGLAMHALLGLGEKRPGSIGISGLGELHPQHVAQEAMYHADAMIAENRRREDKP